MNTVSWVIQPRRALVDGRDPEEQPGSAYGHTSRACRAAPAAQDGVM
jgi:hypothetical protein